MHPWVDAALVQDRVTNIVHAFCVCEGRSWGNDACQCWGLTNQVPVGTDLPARPSDTTGGRACELVQEWHNAATELLDFGERVHLATKIRGDELLAYGDATLGGHELPLGAECKRLSSFRNCVKVTAPLPIRVFGPTAALNVATLHWS
jgi:hypothetical protein